MRKKKYSEMAVENIMLNGCFRSGTTLLDKIFHMHPEIIMASQPFPVLYFYCKEIFLNNIGREYRYPLDHMFKQRDYSQDEFNAFLQVYKITDEDIDVVFKMMGQYLSGLKTPQISKYRDAIKPGTFLEVYQDFNACLEAIFSNKKSPKYVGGKEVFVEEYIPFLLKNGVKVIVIIRDPRDVVASVYNSIDENHMGKNRPLLFLLRAWRKSVAFSLACEDDPNFIWVTYEQLISSTDVTLNKLTKFLQIEPFSDDAFNDGIVAQDGELWRSNSSHASSLELSSSSMGQYQVHLNKDVIAYIESACYPEMCAIGYSFSTLSKFSTDALMSYREEFDITHEKFLNCPDYSYSPHRIADECKRMEFLVEEKMTLSSGDIQNFFILREAFHKLRRAMVRRPLDDC